MQTKNFLSKEDAIEFSKLLVSEDNTVDVAKMVNGMYKVMWIKNKKYISHDGKEFTDEVWTTADGTMLAIQDIDLAHAHNIIRMIIRNDREFLKAADAMMQQLASAMGVSDVTKDNDTPHVLH